MPDEEEYQVQKEPVYARDESPQRLLGWTLEEIGVFMGVAMACLILHLGTKILIGTEIIVFVYIRKIKQHLPEQFLRNYYRYRMRAHRLYRAGGRDSEWRPPIVRDK